MKRVMLFGALVLLLTSCSFAPEEFASLDEQNTYPSMRMEEAHYLWEVPGSEPLRIEAASVEVYDAMQQTHIKEVSFTQSTEEGVLLFSGSCDAAIVDTASDYMNLTGKVIIHNHRDDFVLEAETLQWDHANRIATSDEKTLVTITRSEHDILKGTGFRGDFSTATFEFSHVEEGQLYYDQ